MQQQQQQPSYLKMERHMVCIRVFWIYPGLVKYICIAVFALKKYTFHCAISRLHDNAPLVGYYIRYKAHVVFGRDGSR